MVRNYFQYHSKMTTSWIPPLVNSKGGVDFAMLFPLRLLQRWGKPKLTRCTGVLSQMSVLRERVEVPRISFFFNFAPKILLISYPF